MRALILNSGVGRRMGQASAARPKAMTRLAGGETIFQRQLRLLGGAGVGEFVVTTGPFPEQLAEAAAKPELAGLRVQFVPNPDYRTTNYIYSMHLAGPALAGADTVLVLHGDLVFDQALVAGLLNDERPDLAPYHPEAPLPEKDFRVRLRQGRLAEVGLGLTGPDCYAFQPFYKLSARAWALWSARIDDYVRAGTLGVYAENALNEVAAQARIMPFSYAGHLLAEVDTPGDLTALDAALRLELNL